jgi:5-carboxymethyl-2-hydroxymuconate isomerase
MLEKLTADFPTEPQYRRFLATSRTSLAMSRVNAGQVSEAIAEVTEWAKSWNGNAEEWYNFACVYAAAAGRSAQKRQEYGDRAMELLNKAVQTGFNDAGS